MTEKTPAELLTLPVEIITIIFNFLPNEGRLNLGLTCKDLCAVFEDGRNWRSLNISYWMVDELLVDTLSSFLLSCQLLTSISLHLDPRYDDELTLRSFCFSTQFFLVLSQSCTNLRSLRFEFFAERYTNRYFDFDLAGLLRLLAVNPKVQALDVENAGFLSDTTATAIAKRISDVRILNLSNCDIYQALTDAGIKAVARSCSQLRRLSLAHSRLTWEGLVWLAEQLTLLTYLDIAHTDIRPLHSRPGLTHSLLRGLNVTGCRQLSVEGLQLILSLFPGIVSLSTGVQLRQQLLESAAIKGSSSLPQLM